MFAAFPTGLFLVRAMVLVALPIRFSLKSYSRNRGRRAVVWPENHELATVALGNKFAFRTALHQEEHERCNPARDGPEKGECGQECLAQINPSSENLERLMQKWYQGNCAICERPLSQADWRRSRLAFLNDEQ